MTSQEFFYKIIPIKAFRFFFKKKHGKMFSDWRKEALERYLDIRYFKCFGKHIDFENPVPFTQKLQYYRLYYYTPELKNIVCKYHFKEYVASQLGEGHTIPLLGVWTDADDIDFDALPEQFVLKSNSSSGGRCIEIVRDKSLCSPKALRKELRKWLNPEHTLINSPCRAYWDVQPMILAEEYKEQVGDQLYDYKFFCFNGEPYCVYVAIDHYAGQVSKISFYDLDWNEMDVSYGEHGRNHIEKPKHFDEMLAYARTLSKPFPFVRVDFFATEDEVYVAEMTFYPAGGFAAFNPPSFDLELGNRFQLPAKAGNAAPNT